MTLTSFVVALIAVLVGWVIGFFDSNLRTAKKIKEAEAKAEAEIKIAQNQPKSQLDDTSTLLRLKKDNGQFKLEIDGALVGEILFPEKRRRLIELVTALRPWLEAGSPQQAAPKPPAPIRSAPVPDSVQAAGYSLVQSPPIPKKSEAEINIKALSIVAQIDIVLQMRLADTPFAKRGIRLQESPLGEVEVYVGLDKFLSVDEVTDEAIKAIIRAAIAEWEDKYTPGL